MRTRWLKIAAAWAALLVAAPARAHDESLSTSDVELRGGTLIWRVDVGVAGLVKAVPSLPPEGRFDAAALRVNAAAIGRFLTGGLDVRADGAPVAAALGPLEPRYETPASGGAGVLSRVVQVLTYRAPRADAVWTARVAFFSALTPSHRALVRVHGDHGSRQLVRLGPTELSFAPAAMNVSRARLFGEMFSWGVHHIFVGYDHIAFLLALLLVVRSLRELVTIVTSFTLAHSLTLLLSALNVVSVSSRATEALIAASIVYVAAENLWRGAAPARGRWALTFAFGLVHGLGFATELRDRLAELSGSVVFPVVSFNLGVEAGQLVIVALVYPLLQRLRHAPTPAGARVRARRLVTVGSLPILALGLFWLVDRLAG